jgi:hypothetical protein
MYLPRDKIKQKIPIKPKKFDIRLILFLITFFPERNGNPQPWDIVSRCLKLLYLMWFERQRTLKEMLR